MKKLLLTFLFVSWISPWTLAAGGSSTNRNAVQSNLAFWERTFRYGITAQKESVVDYIRTRRVREAGDLLLKYTGREKNPALRKSMMSLLVSFSNQGVIPLLVKAVKDEKEPALRIFGLMSLGEMKARKQYAAVAEHIDSEDEITAETALRSLGQMEAVECLDRLKEKLRAEKNERIRTGIILALSGLGTEKAQEDLISVFTNGKEKEINRCYAATGLGRIKNRRSFDLLTGQYDGAPPRIRVRIVESLGQLEERDAIGLLIEALKDDDRNIRYYSVMALGKLKARESVEILRYKKDFDPDGRVREKVKEVLKELEGKGKEEQEREGTGRGKK